jgi:hypothetical protein
MEATPATRSFCFRSVVLGEWGTFEGTAFTESDTAVHVVKPFELPTGWERFESMDQSHSSSFPQPARARVTTGGGLPRTVEELSEGARLEVVRSERDVAREGIGEIDEHHERDRHDHCDRGRTERVESEVRRSDEHRVADDHESAEQDENRDVPRKPTAGCLNLDSAGVEGVVQLVYSVIVE